MRENGEWVYLEPVGESNSRTIVRALVSLSQQVLDVRQQKQEQEVIDDMPGGLGKKPVEDVEIRGKAQLNKYCKH